jgi:hypothetical protein
MRRSIYLLVILIRLLMSKRFVKLQTRFRKIIGTLNASVISDKRGFRVSRTLFALR